MTMFVSPEKQSCACRAFLLLLMLLPGSAAAGGPRVTRELDFDWRFHLGDAAGAEAAGYDDASWWTLDLPHDWGIEGEYRPDNPDHGAGAYLPGGIGWYRRVFDVPPEWHDRRVRIEFDAAQRNSDVWINGHLLGHRPYGYISFAYDLTPHLAPGRNVIAVRLDNPLPAARWYTGSGIYSHVRLVVSDKLHVAQWGTFVTTQLAYEGDGEARVATELLNEGADRVNARLVSEVRDERDQVVAVDEHRTVVPPAGPTTRPGVARLQQSLHVERPHPWSPPSPNLYRLVQRLYRGDQLVDQVSTPFGFRSARFDPNDGFRLNGHVLKLKGVGMHYDASPTGVAIPDEVLEDRLRRLKEMGCNAIRTGHTPFPPVFYDLCDRLGLMVIDEAFDGWRKKVEHDYGAESFQQWWKQDLGDMVRRDRSHPSVILWSIGNETGTSDRLGMSEFVRQLDPTRLTTGGQCLLGVCVAGFNGPGEVPGVLTEETHAYQTRGFYRTVTNYRESDPDKLTPFEPYTTREIFAGDGDPQYRSSYDNAPVRMTSRQCWRRTRDTPWISGEFRWAAFDYLGEAHFSGRHWPMRFGNPGIFDASGIPKDTAFFYQSQWSDQPVVHLLPHWTHPLLAPGTVIPVVAYSNCEEVEVFLNGRSLGRKTPRAELLDFVWQVPYEPGEVKAIGYRAGRAVGEAQFRTAGAPAGLKLEWPGPELKADRRDVATVTFSVCDERGVTVPWSMDRVEFALSGPARLLGYENGNPTDVTPHRVPHRDAFYGFGRGFFQATDQDGPIELTAANPVSATSR